MHFLMLFMWVYLQVLKGMCIMDSDIFKRHLREFYPLITKLICCDQVPLTLQKHGIFVLHCKSTLSIFVICATVSRENTRKCLLGRVVFLSICNKIFGVFRDANIDWCKQINYASFNADGCTWGPWRSFYHTADCSYA